MRCLTSFGDVQLAVRWLAGRTRFGTKAPFQTNHFERRVRSVAATQSLLDPSLCLTGIVGRQNLGRLGTVWSYRIMLRSGRSGQSTPLFQICASLDGKSM